MNGYANAWATSCPPYLAEDMINGSSVWLGGQFNGYTLGSIMNGNIRAAEAIAASKPYLVLPIQFSAPFLSASVQETTQELFKRAYTFGSINYLSSKK